MLLVILFFIIGICTLKIKLFIYIDGHIHKYYAKLYLFSFLRIGKFDLSKFNNKYKYNWNKKLKGAIDFKLIKKQLKEVKRNRKIKLEKLSIKADICITDAVLTSYFAALISAFIPLIIRLFNFKINYKKFFYRINPIYDSKKVLNIKVQCIISANLVHIISTISKTMKEWRSEENGRKSSNRRAYGHCYE